MYMHIFSRLIRFKKPFPILISTFDVYVRMYVYEYIHKLRWVRRHGPAGSAASLGTSKGTIYSSRYCKTANVYGGMETCFARFRANAYQRRRAREREREREGERVPCDTPGGNGGESSWAVSY